MDEINYSLCWEDQDVLVKALEIGPGDDILSITSGGCNTLALLLARPRSVTAIDNNPAQNYLLELKIAAIKELEYQDLLAFLGVKKSKDRIEQFQKLKNHLSPDALMWWEARTNLIDIGIIHIGKFENYLKLFRKKILPFIHSKKTIHRIFVLDDLKTQEKFWDSEWNNWRMRAFTRIFFSEPVMSRLGRGKERFTYSETRNLGKYYMEKSKRIFTDIPLKDNYLFDYILNGTYSSQASMPTYLKEENFALLKSELHKLKIVTMDLGKFLTGSSDSSFSGFNLSDVFEAMSLEQTDTLFRELVRIGKANARLVFWNNLVPRKHPIFLDEQIISDSIKAQELSVLDRAFLYSGLYVERIIK